ncbi:hypothetical protein M5J20_06750 [Corynebacterium sp. TA-R-1]|uniref:Pentapeptide MXKDX repeat protein n=1 Tax=Corynebacterium stercoris TaxID=2943490 RepID=A0ABT1G1I7_9CORY|nr:hypothetical protein [Corynebacterium stercoris]MCP1387889.1 hypothetical protein [Corynebacterium stercoris]
MSFTRTTSKARLFAAATALVAGAAGLAACDDSGSSKGTSEMMSPSSAMMSSEMMEPSDKMEPSDAMMSSEMMEPSDKMEPSDAMMSTEPSK